jgi:hypothetical protein
VISKQYLFTPAFYNFPAVSFLEAQLKFGFWYLVLHTSPKIVQDSQSCALNHGIYAYCESVCST